MYKSETRYYRKAFFTAMIMAAILFLPFVIFDGGYFIYYGDYNAQQIPFYYLCNKSIKAGSFMWDWYTDLGTNFIGSYSFYTIGSPFFWISMVLPPQLAKYAMAPLMILKMSLCSLFAFTYIRRFVCKPESALIGALLYAFSGFSVYNVFFNHFHEAMVVFPLMLIALEEAVVNKRRVLFALTVALNAFINYFFFAGECIFLVIYFLCRCTDKRFDINLKTFFALAFESVFGVLLAGVMFIPAIVCCLDVPRTDNMLIGWDMVFHNPSQRYGLIFQSLFFPPDIPARQNFFPDTSAKWSSVSAYLPLFSMAGVISFIRYKKGHWAKFLMPICLLFALVPILNSTFVLLNRSYYTRWFYMPVLIACFMTSYALEDDSIDMKYGVKWCGFAAVMISLVGILPSEQKEKVTNSSTGVESEINVAKLFELPKEKAPFWISVGLAFAAIILCWFIVRNKDKIRKQVFLKRVFVFTGAACLVFSFYAITYGRIIGPNHGDYNSVVDAEIELDDDGETFYRIESYGVTNNANMLWDMYGFRSFQSILPGSAFSYYENMGFHRSVNTDPDGTFFAMRSLNSTKYLIMQTYKENYKDTKTLLENMKNFEKIGEQNGFSIYKNTAFVPMGYSYDHYISEKDYYEISKSNRDNTLLKTCVLTSQQIMKYKSILSEADISNSSDFSYDAFVEDCKKLSTQCVDSFETTTNGFVAKSSFTTDRFVVFTVPWESGWSATINGKPAAVEKVNGGVIGIKVPKGSCEIVFDYVTPGLIMGVLSTLAAAVILVVYYIILRLVFKYKPNPNAHLYFERQLEGIDNHIAYLKTLSDRTTNEKKAEKEQNSSAQADDTSTEKDEKQAQSAADGSTGSDTDAADTPTEQSKDAKDEKSVGSEADVNNTAKDNSESNDKNGNKNSKKR